MMSFPQMVHVVSSVMLLAVDTKEQLLLLLLLVVLLMKKKIAWIPIHIMMFQIYHHAIKIVVAESKVAATTITISTIDYLRFFLLLVSD